MSDVTRIKTPIRLPYTVIAGRELSRFLKGITQKKILGRRCPDCHKVYVPPRGACAACGVLTDQEVEVSLLSLEITEREVLAGLETSLRAIDSYGAQIEVAQVRLDLAAQTADASEATYEAGRNTLRDVLEAQAALKEARVARVQAEVELLKSRVDLELLRGSLLEVLGVEAR